MRGAGLRRRAGAPWLTAVALALAAAGCAGPDKAPEFERVAAREIAAHPGRYSFGDSRAVLIGRDGVPRGLIWGTMHVSYADDTVLPRPIRDRFAQAASLSVEYDSVGSPRDERLRVQRRITEAMNRHDPAALARLDPATRAALGASGLPPGSTERHSLLGLSWLVTVRATRDTERPLTPSIDFVDGLLMRFARGRGIPVRGLEDPNHHFDALFGGDPNGPEAASDLRSALRCAADARDLMRWARRTYAQGRIAATSAALEAFCAEPSAAPFDAERRARTLTRRNVVMADGIEAALAEPGFHFVAIGAAHLLGEDGVPALLRARGWTVTPCPEDRC